MSLEERLAAIEKKLGMGGLAEPDPSRETVDAINRQNAVLGSLMQDAVTGQLLKGPLRIGNVNVREGAITADKITVETLSALTVDAGELEAGTITGLLIRTSPDGARVAMSGEANGGLIGYNTADTYDPVSGAGTYQILWKKTDGKFYFADGVGVLSDLGIEFTDPTAVSRLIWNGAARTAAIQGYSSAGAGSISLRADYDVDNFCSAVSYADISNPRFNITIKRGGNQHNLRVPELVDKTGDETINNSAVLQDDNNLKLVSPAASHWAFELFLMYDSGTTPDIKFGWSVPAGCTMHYLFYYEPTNSMLKCDETTVTAAAGGGAGTVMLVHMKGLISVGANAGTVQLQWAQNTADASDTKVLSGSYLMATQLFA